MNLNEIINCAYSFFIWNINSSIKASILVIFILLIRVVLREKISVKLQYIIWFLVVFRLLVPTSFESRLSIYNIIPTIEQNSSIISSSDKNSNNVISVQDNFSEDENNKVEISFKPAYRIENDNSKLILYNSPIFLFFIWLIGMFLSLSSAVFQNFKFNKIIRRETVIEEYKIINLFEECKAKMFATKYIPLIITEEVKVPTLYGVISPKLLIPQNILKTLTLKDLRFIFLHELAHFKRKDILVYWVLTTFTALHWFNPLILYAFHKIKEDCELCCDSLVLNSVGQEESIEYGHTIIKFAENMSREHKLITGTSILKNKYQIKRRITMIKLFKKNNHRLSICAIVLLAIIGLLSLTNATSKPIKPLEEVKSANIPKDKSNHKNIIIYNTHIFETYSYGDSVIDVAKALENKLSKLGLESTYLEMPKNIEPSKSYAISRKLIMDSSKNYNNSILIDLHRDIAPTTENDKKNLIHIVLGKNNPNFNENNKFAKLVLEELKKANEIKADIFISERSTYNQDLSKQSILIDIGNENSSKQDVENCVDALGEAFKKVTLESN